MSNSGGDTNHEGSGAKDEFAILLRKEEDTILLSDAVGEACEVLIDEEWTQVLLKPPSACALEHKTEGGVRRVGGGQLSIRSCRMLGRQSRWK